MSDDTVSTIAERIGSVAQLWRDAVAPKLSAVRRAADVGGQLGLGIEAIYEGYALHHAQGRTLADGTSVALRLLIGDHCYAAGLCDVAATGDLDAVAQLADIVADVAVLAAEPGDTAEAREARWTDGLAPLAR